ncbi:uncharacterized protein N7484_001072 [Penicillium longicatenatum]|uniref:uncharacterized protein n=1 Tax=Penicillium longicatenatum TaxID=1561947 RepID=UPI0025476A3E|nr:uncharacterized protein N7484_001072 [Penicillium longicatenatum]KAJ5657423.1 hypothetical protein N7484_001072 [Penicillium longicatenatum]
MSQKPTSQPERARSASIPSKPKQKPPSYESTVEGSLDNSRASTRRKRSRHQRRQYSRTDIIDGLDHTSPCIYHHEGPFDAASVRRNAVKKYSPLDAMKESNAEALRATPRERIMDAINSHRPLDGTGFYPPNTIGRNGQLYEYEEGGNMMNEYGIFSRQPGMKFTDKAFQNDPFYRTST